MAVVWERRRMSVCYMKKERLVKEHRCPTKRLYCNISFGINQGKFLGEGDGGSVSAG